MIIDEPPSRERTTGKRVLTYILTLFVAAVAIYGMTEFLAPITAPKAGDCATVTGHPDRPDFGEVNCTSSNANYLVAGSVAKSETCRDSYADVVTGRPQDPEIRICLVPLWTEGACYPAENARVEFTPVECGANAFKVTKVSRDVPAPPCAAGEKRYSYAELKLAYCTSTFQQVPAVVTFP